MRDIEELLDLIAALIYELLPELERRRYDVSWKPDGSPVTAADVFLENVIRNRLSAEIPNLTFVGEESWQAESIVGDGWVAVLDPIDGTENFCSGLKEWGVSLSMWKGGIHRGSMLMMPELGEVMRTGVIHRVPRSRIVGFSSSFNPKIGKGLAETPEGRIMGCAVYNLFNVIRGSFAGFINPKGAYSWDLLAGVALATEAGCDVKVNDEKYDGRFLEPNRRYRVDIRHRYNFHTGEGAIG